MRRMSDREYAHARDDQDGPVCPFCRGTDVAVVFALHWDQEEQTSGMACETFACMSCKRRWTEILRPVAYEIE